MSRYGQRRPTVYLVQSSARSIRGGLAFNSKPPSTKSLTFSVPSVYNAPILKSILSRSRTDLSIAAEEIYNHMLNTQTNLKKPEKREPS